MLKVLVKAPALSMSGYGEQARFLLESLKDRKDIDLYLIDIPWGKSNQIYDRSENFLWMKKLITKTAICHAQDKNMTYDMSLQVTIPNEWERIAPVNIGYTAGIECDRVSPYWIQKGNEMSKIITISEHSKNVYKDTKYEVLNEDDQLIDLLHLKTPIEVVNYSTRNTSPSENFSLDLQTNFNFLTVAQFGPRKNLPILVESFIKEFHDNKDVGLVVKTHVINPSISDKVRSRRVIRNLTEKYPDRKCKIYLLHGEMTEQQMCSLYRHPKIKAFTTTTHGEGFGLPIFEAACNGLPVVAPNWSGHMDFLSYPDPKKKKEKLFREIPCYLDRVHESAVWETVIENGSMWAHVKESDVMLALRDLYKSHNRFRRKAKKLKEHVLRDFDEKVIFKKMNEAIFNDSTQEQETPDVHRIKEEAMMIESPKQRAAFLKEAMGNISSQADKLELLKDSFSNKTAYVLSCGPSLLKNNQENLTNLIQDNLTISIKQAYDLYAENVDFHVYNCANFKQYDYEKKEPIIVEAASTPYKLGHCDIKFFIQEREFANSVSSKNNISDWTYEKEPLLRPYGPGIMYEAAFYLAQHLGVKKIVTVGWDNKLLDASMENQHFYDMNDSVYQKDDFIHHNEVAKNITRQGLDHEIKITSDCIKDWNTWLASEGIELNICSDLNPAPKEIKRVKI